MSNVDWIKIKNEYVNSNISQRDLAQKYIIPYQTLRDRAAKENWFEKKKIQRSKIGAKTEQKTAEKIAEKEADRLTRIKTAADRLLDKIEEATEQLDNHFVKNKKKTKVIEYNNPDRPDKPTKETIEEYEEAEFVTGDVDRLGLKMIAGALKEVKDIIESTQVENTAVEDLTPLSEMLK